MIIRPADEILEQPFWRHLAEGRLHLCTCNECGTAQHPPAPICPNCRSFDMGWKPASGKAKLRSFAVCHHAVHPSLVDKVPYTITLVELAENVRMISAIPHGMQVDLKIGMDLDCKVIPQGERFALAFFTPPSEN